MFAELRETLTGPLVTPADPDWDQARASFNRSIDQRPRAVVVAADPSDVERTVAFAAAHGLKVSAQGARHGATESLNDTILIRTDALDDVWVDAEARIARLGAGVRWDALQQALDGTGLTGLIGSTGAVSVVGYCLGGGLSWFSRPYGSGAGSLRSAEIVDATGSRRWIDDASDPDLMWALRGGGGNLAVVTSVEVDLHPAPEISGGRLTFPIDDAKAVLTAYVKATVDAPDQVSLWAQLINFPDLPILPDAIRGRSFCMIDAVAPYDPTALSDALAPIRAAGTVLADTIGPLKASEVGHVAQEPTEPVAHALSACTLDELPPELIDALLAHTDRSSLITQVQLRNLRASEEVRRPGIAAMDPAARYLAVAVAVVPAPALQQPAEQALAALRAIMAPWFAGRVPPSMLSPGNTLRDSLSEPDLARLRMIKQQVDPAGVLIGNFPLG